MRPLLPVAACLVAQPMLFRASRISVFVSLHQTRCLAQTHARRQEDDEPWPPPPPPPLPTWPPTGTTVPVKDRAFFSPEQSIPDPTKHIIDSIYGPATDHTSTAPSSPSSTRITDDTIEMLLNTMQSTKSSPSKAEKNVDTQVLYYPKGFISPKKSEAQPYHLHVYSHKHNTHITCTRPNRDPILSLSCGNLGYKKARRGTFDSAYSLTKYVLERLSAAQIDINALELVLRGYGPGREAAVKVLMSPEGKNFRSKIVRVADSTPIKFSGKRSEKPRRL